MAQINNSTVPKFTQLFAKPFPCRDPANFSTFTERCVMEQEPPVRIFNVTSATDANGKVFKIGHDQTAYIKEKLDNKMKKTNQLINRRTIFYDDQGELISAPIYKNMY